LGLIEFFRPRAGPFQLGEQLVEGDSPVLLSVGKELFLGTREEPGGPSAAAPMQVVQGGRGLDQTLQEIRVLAGFIQPDFLDRPLP